ncbi:MAG: site-2 protease family protein, partial [Chloroflexi bacterium]|nr:site-2 protease family protein [Chloroflexota bacterium]
DDRDIVLLPVFLLLLLLVGSSVATLLSARWHTQPGAFAALGVLTVTALLLVVWLLGRELTADAAPRRQAARRRVWRVVVALLLAQLSLFTALNLGGQARFSWSVLSPQLVGFSLVLLWLAVSMVMARQQEGHPSGPAHNAMSRTQAVVVMLAMCLVLVVATVLTVNMPYWLTREQVLEAVAAHALLLMQAWPFVVNGGAFALLVIALMAAHELGHGLLAALCGLPVSRVVVGSLKGEPLAVLHPGGQRVEVYRRLPILMALDVDDQALISAGFLRRTAFGLAGPLANCVLAFAVGVGFLGLGRGSALAGEFVAHSGRAMATFFLGPLGFGSAAEFFNSPLLGTLQAAQNAGLPSAAAWWMALNALVGVANLLPLPALDGGLVAVSLWMRLAGEGEPAAAVFRRWYAAAPKVAAWLPWLFVALTVVHVVRLALGL